MRGLKIFLIVMIFVCLAVGFALVFGGGLFISKKRNSPDVAHRKTLRLKLIGYVLLLSSLAFAIFQSMIEL